MDNGKDLFAYDVCEAHEADYEKIIQCNDCAVYTNSERADMERPRIAEARREAANEVIEKMKGLSKHRYTDKKHHDAILWMHVVELINSYKETKQ